EGVEHRAGHRHAEVCLVMLWRVGEQGGNGVASRDAHSSQRRSESTRARVRLGPGEPPLAVNDGDAIRTHSRAPGDEVDRSQGRVVRRILVEPDVVGIGVRGHGTLSADWQPLGDGQATGRAAVRARTDWNSVVRRWGIVFGSARAPRNDSAPEMARYTA